LLSYYGHKCDIKHASALIIIKYTEDT